LAIPGSRAIATNRKRLAFIVISKLNRMGGEFWKL
jgi:hypothetical protein